MSDTTAWSWELCQERHKALEHLIEGGFAASREKMTELKVSVDGISLALYHDNGNKSLQTKVNDITSTVVLLRRVTYSVLMALVMGALAIGWRVFIAHAPLLDTSSPATHPPVAMQRAAN